MSIVRSIPWVVILAPAAATAGGFYLPEVGARATALAAGGAAHNVDPSAVVHNPAGMAGQRGTRIELSGLLALPSIHYFKRPVTDPATGETLAFDGVTNEGPPAIVPFLAAQTDLIGHGVLIGLAVHAPFGAHLEYPEDGSQRHVVTSLALRTIFAGPAVTFWITDELSIGATLDYVFSDLAIHQRNALQFVTGDPEANPNPAPEVEGSTAIDVKDAFTITSRFGILYQTRRFSLGATLRLPTTLRMKGEAVVENGTITALLDDEGNELQPRGRRVDDVAIDLPLPLILAIGARLELFPWLEIGFEGSWQRWRTFDALTVDFANEHELLPTPGANLYDVRAENGWHDTIALRLGVESIPIESLPLAIRAGVLFDQSPIDDRHFDLLAPDSDKLGVSVGLGYTFELTDTIGLDVAAAYLHLFFRERNVGPSETTVAGTDTPIPGTDKTILNKSAPSFYYGVTRARAELFSLTIGLRL